MINVFEPQVTQSDIEEVTKVLNSNWLGKGSVVDSFEKNFAGFIGCTEEQVLSVNSCTQAAFILAEFLSPQRDVVILPSMSFVGVANAFIKNGFSIHFVDVSVATLNIEVDDIKDLVLEYRDRAVVVLNHFAAGSDSLEKIVSLCASAGTILIEDAAGALGAVKNGKSLGTYGDYGIWSFDAMKTITCGDGGMIYSKDPESVLDLTRRAYLGLITESGYKNSTNTSRNKWWEFQISGPHSRSIMNDISASLGLSQLKRIEETLNERELIANQYSMVFNKAGLDITPSQKVLLDRSPNYIFPIFVEGRRDQLASYLREHSVYTTFRYFPLHEVSFFAGSSNRQLPNTRKIQDSLLLLPLHPKLNSVQVDTISSLVVDFLSG